MAFSVKFLNPPQQTDSHPCTRLGGPVASLGGPVASLGAPSCFQNTIRYIRLLLESPGTLPETTF